MGGEIAFDEETRHLARGSGDAALGEEAIEGHVGALGGDALHEPREPHPDLAHRAQPSALRPDVLVGKLHDREPRRVGDLACRLRLAVEELGSQLDRQRPLWVVDGEDAPAEAGTGLEHHHVAPGVAKSAGGGQPGRAGTDHDRVDFRPRHVQ